MHESLASTSMRDALRVFGEKGFDHATAEDLAEASGISRATFFRRYRSKTDILFADHDALIARVEQILEYSTADPFDAICEAAEFVLTQLLSDPEIARARYDLVHEVAALREREILTIRRYELLFAKHLRRRVPGIDSDNAVACAAAVVAVHNTAHREWLSGDESVTPRSLGARVRRVAARFRGTNPVSGAARVIALRIDDATSPRDLLAQLEPLFREDSPLAHADVVPGEVV